MSYFRVVILFSVFTLFGAAFLSCVKPYSLGPISPSAPNTPTVAATPSSTVIPTSTPIVTSTPNGSAPAMNINCSADSISPAASTGKYGIDYATSIVPLCDGWVLYGDLTNNKIQAVNAVYGVVGNSYQLSATPGDLAYDPSTGFLYAILTSASFVAKINLNNGTVTNIPLPAQGVHLAAASNGYLFVSMDSSYMWPNEQISYINATSGSVLGTVSIASFNSDAYLACNSAGTTLYVGAGGCSGCTVYQYAFNTSTYALTQQYSITGTFTSNGEEMTLSPDQNHVVWVNGGGNGSGYTIYDLFSSDINNSYGSFNTGPYPISAGFSPDSNNITTTNGADLQVFGVSTHAASKTTWTGASAGSGGVPYNIYELERTRFSKGGNLVYGLDAPTYTTPAPSTIIWETFP